MALDLVDATFFCHWSLPLVVRLRRTRSLPSAAVRKMLFFQITGVELPMPGRANFQATFSVALHLLGRPVSLEIPSLVGPRHCGQSSAWVKVANANNKP